MTFRARVLAFFIFGAVAIANSFAFAQARPPDNDRDTVAQITPYLWAAGVGGSATPFSGAPTFESSKSFFDLVKDLDAALFVSGLVRKGRFVAVGDFSHNAASREGTVRTGNPALPVASAEGSFNQTSATALIGMRALNRSDITVDLLEGARAVWLDTDVVVPAAGIARSPSPELVDPIIATRVIFRLDQNWSLLFHSDLAGFGVYVPNRGDGERPAGLEHLAFWRLPLSRPRLPERNIGCRCSHRWPVVRRDRRRLS